MNTFNPWTTGEHSTHIETSRWFDQNGGLGGMWSQFSDQQEQNQEILTQCDSSVGLKLISGQNTP